ncbi:hypothetical protein DC366_00825 [Pelagivirga sediminicola]|uniref:Coat protein n=1 Tax=Pelagivirga sediminicola TaxID=2170575 RepID=A0A2T7GAU9_9RHOB|nr:hypothetical protein DC366_00825 [Pelagivirga sediminicola]
MVIPQEFTDYTVQNSMETSALVQSGVAARNGEIEAQLKAGAESFTVPFWNDLSDEEADIVSDDPNTDSTPAKIGTGKQVVRKAFLHKSWSAMNLASELSGDDALKRIQNRTTAYWTRQTQRRLIASLNGILADNEANDAGDMPEDITAGPDGNFSVGAVIDAAGTLGDQMGALSAIAVHSDTYKLILKSDAVEYVPSQGGTIATYRGMALIVDDLLPVTAGDYTSVLFGAGAVGWGMTAPRIAEGTEIESKPSAGNRGGQQVLHSRVNLAIHPAGFTWQESAVVGESATIAELAEPTNWNRVVERKAVPLAFLKHKLG